MNRSGVKPSRIDDVNRRIKIRKAVLRSGLTLEEVAESNGWDLAEVRVVAEKAKDSPKANGLDGLKHLERLFCQAYVLPGCHSAASAALAAGYRSGVMGDMLLQRPHVQKWIREFREKMALEHEVTVQRLVQELACIAFLDQKDLYDENGTLKPIHEMSEEARRAIAGVKVSEIRERGEKVGEITEVKAWSKPDSLKVLMQHLGALTEKVDVTSQGEKMPGVVVYVPDNGRNSGE